VLIEMRLPSLRASRSRRPPAAIREKTEERMVLVGDFHAATPQRAKLVNQALRRVIREENPTELASTGDFDHPELVESFRILHSQLEARGTRVIAGAGNHDRCNPRGKPAKDVITSSTLAKQGLASNEPLITAFKQPRYAAALHYVERLPLKLEFVFGGVGMRLIHGGDAGSLKSNPAAAAVSRPLWRRMDVRRRDGSRNLEPYRDIFGILNAKNCGVEIRGHDHPPELAVKSARGVLTVHEVRAGDKFKLPVGGKAVITHGSFHDGWYAVLTKTSAGLFVEFKKIPVPW
jgi:hypothetical protein